ncbi:hypothetical protein FQN49_006969 [Arthroderma sp. PD_2]|nr:hypothetical protein FQN49_006969 [Arthroderma sp. PD_2]
MEPFITVELTPPRANGETMSALEYVTSDHSIGILKRKLGVDSLEERRIRLQPPVRDHETTNEYYQRSNPTAIIPLSPVVRSFSARYDDLQGQNNKLTETNRILEEQHQTVLETNQIFLEKISALERDKKIYLQQKANLFIGNMLIELVKKISPKDTPASSKKTPRVDNHDFSTHRLSQRAADLKEKDFRKFNIQSKYWKTIRNLKKYVVTRNTYAHESYEEFARVLKDPCMESYYIEWSGLFEATYDETVESVVERCGQLFELEK